MNEYKYSGVLERDDGSEVEFVIGYKVSAGLPATPPAYDHGGMPAEEPEVYDMRVISCSVLGIGEDCVFDAVTAEELLSSAAEEEQYRRDEAADHRRGY